MDRHGGHVEQGHGRLDGPLGLGLGHGLGRLPIWLTSSRTSLSTQVLLLQSLPPVTSY